MRVDRMILCVDVIAPNFIEIDGMVLNESRIPIEPHFSNWRKKAKKSAKDKCGVEFVINHIHMGDLFYQDPDRDEIDDIVYQEIAKAITRVWEALLIKQFPDRSFIVGVSGEEFDPEVFFYTDRDLDSSK